MLWAFLVLALTAVIVLGAISQQLGQLHALIRAASDLNLEAHTRLLEATQENERHLADMPKMYDRGRRP